ncbi:MAG: hypothetical protein ABSA83_23130 [Verrucomicrobiota bacterium]|jgi:hypothetical protein
MIWPRNIVAAVILCLGQAAGAQVTNSSMSTADAFLCTGSPSNPELNGADLSGLNFGAAGTLVVAPASSPKGEFQSVVKFNLSNGVAMFNSAYGSNNWFVSGISLQLTSNYGTSGMQPNNGIFPVISGGNFVIEWLSDDDWVEGTGTPNLPTTDGVDYDSLPELLTGPQEILCTNTYTPPGNNVPVIYTLPLATNLVADILGGGDVTLLFFAADNQIDYLFNSYNYGRGNQPLLNVVATPFLKILSGAFTNSLFRLIGLSSNNSICQIQASTNLSTTNWQTIGTVTAGTNGAIQFYDSGVTNQPQRYYRFCQ